ncbi:MAG: hypothetical protein ACXAC7_22520, partial [Candidatus Hodarchaeales archaeon]
MINLDETNLSIQERYDRIYTWLNYYGREYIENVYELRINNINQTESNSDEIITSIDGQDYTQHEYKEYLITEKTFYIRFFQDILRNLPKSSEANQADIFFIFSDIRNGYYLGFEIFYVATDTFNISMNSYTE